ncbi:hypothetical protein A3I56_02625 [Candidatus Roizmanbacteria bacterium RIFCSPLOWO2_02_FULL_43_10]|uniref:Uncharacterized protein n=1 Tax=Candidatus Roizmanbacteria bacterium RIFCSPLOWO2_02_FULL_43_10 TaxID=1802078 RepID=A0A1F7JX36_9BACT|nr:MAG: hypothetical protein A3I56_02625 [Candidatus Roizmanbacteria bacterium RIFCSPLOWO2_02_FULL_43_10]
MPESEPAAETQVLTDQAPRKAKPVDGGIALARLLVTYATKDLSKSSQIIKPLEFAGIVLEEAPKGLAVLMELADGLPEEQAEALLGGYAGGMAVSCLNLAVIKSEDPKEESVQFGKAKAKSLDFLKEMRALRTSTPPPPQKTPNP